MAVGKKIYCRKCNRYLGYMFEDTQDMRITCRCGNPTVIAQSANENTVDSVRCGKCASILGYSMEDGQYILPRHCSIYHAVRLACTVCSKSRTWQPAELLDDRTAEQIAAEEFLLSRIGSSARELSKHNIEQDEEVY
jgi:hypothetical protein